MRLEDSFQVFGRALAVPGAVRVHDGYRAIDADAQALHLRTEDAAVHILQAEFLEPPLEVVPAHLGPGDRSTLSASHAQEDMATLLADVQLGESSVDDCLRLLGAPLWVWETAEDGRPGAVLAYGWYRGWPTAGTAPTSACSA